jgi:F-type H+-transporting ATPase subunit epsilon
MTVQVDIVSAEREIFSGEAEMVFAPAILGEVGIAPGHASMLSRLGPGEVRLRLANSEESSFYVSGGLLEVQPKVVTILSDTAERAEDLDESLVLKAKEAAEIALADTDATIDYAKARVELAETIAQLQTIQRLRGRTGR